MQLEISGRRLCLFVTIFICFVVALCVRYAMWPYSKGSMSVFFHSGCYVVRSIGRTNITVRANFLLTSVQHITPHSTFVDFKRSAHCSFCCCFCCMNSFWLKHYRKWALILQANTVFFISLVFFSRHMPVYAALRTVYETEAKTRKNVFKCRTLERVKRKWCNASEWLGTKGNRHKRNALKSICVRHTQTMRMKIQKLCEFKWHEMCDETQNRIKTTKNCFFCFAIRLKSKKKRKWNEEESENGFGQKASSEPNIQLEASRYLFSLAAAATAAAAAHIPRSSGKYVPKIEPHEGKKNNTSEYIHIFCNGVVSIYTCIYIHWTYIRISIQRWCWLPHFSATYKFLFYKRTKAD